MFKKALFILAFAATVVFLVACDAQPQKQAQAEPDAHPLPPSPPRFEVTQSADTDFGTLFMVVDRTTSATYLGMHSSANVSFTRVDTPPNPTLDALVVEMKRSNELAMAQMDQTNKALIEINKTLKQLTSATTMTHTLPGGRIVTTPDGRLIQEVPAKVK